MDNYGFDKENIFENALISTLTGKYKEETLEILEVDVEKDGFVDIEYQKNKVYRTKLWKYEPNIKSTKDLWDNFKAIVEKRNKKVLKERILTDREFAQIKNKISTLYTPFQAGQFLYGHNGISQVEIDLDDGTHVYLNIFDHHQIGAGDTEYQVVTQIYREAKIPGRRERRFDTTLLINGLPVIQIEEKAAGHSVDEAIYQMEEYINENQYSDIFSTVQILVAMTPSDIKYMANTTAELFNTDFSFRWQDMDCKTIRDWYKFTQLFLSIPMAHKMVTNYTVLDGTTNRQMLKVMRPYQVYATEAVLAKLKKSIVNMGEQKVGYVWHTTGSGKTITSFKTAWLASRLPQVEKVVFVVDRLALTRQTLNCYQAYDPEGASGLKGATSIESIDNKQELVRNLKSKGNSIIVSSIQKLVSLAKDWENKDIPAKHKKIVFIVDEAHRSTGGDSMELVQRIFNNGYWIGYTGTPMFDDIVTGSKNSTRKVFGHVLHQYTIREAISDKNVLGFKVDFETTLDRKQMKEEYLPAFYRNKYPSWSDADIKYKIEHLSDMDMDDTVEASVYDNNINHVRLVVEDIFKNWQNRSNNGKYNALLTTHVGGGVSSIPMALMYFEEFNRVNEERKAKGLFTLKVGITFSRKADNSEGQAQINSGLNKGIEHHNKLFGTSFEDKDVSAYTQDVADRLARTVRDKQYYDLVIVVDQLLTGFDAPQLNTLYVDRTLSRANLIQAYSRTNRISNRQEKPWGRIVNYRWPAHCEKLMDEALGIYANKNSALVQGGLIIDEDDEKIDLVDAGVLAGSFKDEINKAKNILERLDGFTNNYTELPPSEAAKEEMLNVLREYSRSISRLKQYDPEEIDGELVGFDYNRPDQLIGLLGITPQQHQQLTVSLYNQLKDEIAKEKKVPVAQIEFAMSHVKDVRVNYDYLTELVEALLNEVHAENYEKAKITRDKIKDFTLSIEDRNYAKDINKVADAILSKEYPPAGHNLNYPVKLENSAEIISDAIKLNKISIIDVFRAKWGIMKIITGAELLRLFATHEYGNRSDLNEAGELQELQKQAANIYKTDSLDKEVSSLSKIKYRNGLKDAIYQLADDLIGNV